MDTMDENTCKYCLKLLPENCNCIFCEICKSWIHIKCLRMSLCRLRELDNSNDPFYCPKCIAAELPFMLLSDRIFNISVITSSIPIVNVRNLSFPCKFCNNSCKRNQNSIFCEVCQLWVHLKCTALSIHQFKDYASNSLPYFCSSCLSENLPLNALEPIDHGELCDDDSYLSIDNIDSHFESNCYNANDLIILHVNTRSLIKNIDRLEELICLMKYQPDVIAITETKLNDKTIK